MKKVAYIFPGFGYSAQRQIYKRLARRFEEAGFEAHSIEVKWDMKREMFALSGIADSFVKSLDRKRDSEVYLLGFSYGAVIALMVAERIFPKIAILCSLSPYFKEDIDKLPKNWKEAYLKTKFPYEEDISFDAIAKRVKSRVMLFLGDKEAKEVDSRARDAYKKLKNSSLEVIKGAPHNLASYPYYRKLKSVITDLA